jgi:7-cyano-7-deazaguanine synthase in queuosine biosynthesis
MAKTARADDSTLVIGPPSDFPGRNVFSTRDNLPGLNALTIAWAVFELEKGRKGRFVRRAFLPIYEPTALGYNLDELSALIRELILFVFADDIEIEFNPISIRGSVTESGASEFETVKDLCLFSGGVDSYSGILLAKKVLGSVEGVFCGHIDQSKASSIVKAIEETILKEAGISLQRIKAPRIGSGGYAQLRGFFYVLSAGAWIQALQGSRLLITECGPTMYQPRFGPFDAITMTTHPVVMDLASQALDFILKRRIQISKPFENMTKAEVMASSPEKEGLRLTHSCVTQRFGYHDGTCYGCIIRRLGALAADVPDVDYQRDPLIDGTANAGNLLSLLVYCAEILTNYREMDSFEIEKIEQYNKLDLFRRFSLDNFAAIHRVIAGGSVVRPAVKNLYDEVVGEIGRLSLERRIQQLCRQGRTKTRAQILKRLEMTA